MAARWRYSPDAKWLRCEGSINEQQIRTGGGKTTAISRFSSPANTLSGQENRSGERRAFEGGLACFRVGGEGEEGEEGLYVCSFSTNIFLAVVIIRDS